MSFQPRFANGIYRDCKWCNGRGCNFCEAEADMEYKRQFPDGPKPIATFDTSKPGSAEKLIKSIFGKRAIKSVKVEAARRTEKTMDNPLVRQILVGPTNGDDVKAAASSLHFSEVLSERIVEKSKKEAQ